MLYISDLFYELFLMTNVSSKFSEKNVRVKRRRRCIPVAKKTRTGEFSTETIMLCIFGRDPKYQFLDVPSVLVFLATGI